jgi:hypothetical protein
MSDRADESYPLASDNRNWAVSGSVELQDLNAPANPTEFFLRNGWLGPFPLLDEEGCKVVFDSYTAYSERFLPPDQMKGRTERGLFDEQPWFKNMHTSLPAFFDLATHVDIVSKVRALLGEDVIAWGVTVKSLRPGRAHRWHVDVEHKHWNGVSVFLALRNVTLQSTLKLISGSQLLCDAPQDLAANTDREVIKAAQDRGIRGDLVSVDMKDGEFFLFAGRLWHGSENTSEVLRHAVILQYTTSDTTVRVPTTWEEPIRWHSVYPPCVLVSGSPGGSQNTLVTRPTGDCLAKWR